MSRPASNAAEGIVLVEIGDKKWPIRYSMRALKELQEYFEVDSHSKLFNNAKDWAVEDIAMFLEVGLRHAADKKGKPEAGSVPDVEAILDEVEARDLPVCLEAVKRAMSASATGKAEEPKGNGALPLADAVAAAPAH